MKHFNKISAITLFFLLAFFLAGCGGGSSSNNNGNLPSPTPPIEETVTYDDIIHKYQVDRLKNEVYYFPANTPANEKIALQPLSQFDLIFVGHAGSNDTSEEGQLTTDIIPGTYTHMLMYIGKDSDGLAYGIEMNVDENATKKSLLNEKATPKLISKNLAELKANKVSKKNLMNTY